MNEFFPVIAGLLVGSTIGALRWRLGQAVGLALSGALGVVATVISGESQLSWAYLVVDIPLVGLATLTALLLTRRLRPAARSRAGARTTEA